MIKKIEALNLDGMPDKRRLWSERDVASIEYFKANPDRIKDLLAYPFDNKLAVYDGYHRLEAAIQLGWDSIDICVMTVAEASRFTNLEQRH